MNQRLGKSPLTSGAIDKLDIFKQKEAAIKGSRIYFTTFTKRFFFKNLLFQTLSYIFAKWKWEFINKGVLLESLILDFKGQN